MRNVLAGLFIVLLSAGAQAQGISGLFRSVTNSLGGGGRQEQPQQQGSTAVLGVRGMDQADSAAAAPPASQDYVLMEGWAATRPEAEALAKKKGLASRPAMLGKADVPATAASGDVK